MTLEEFFKHKKEIISKTKATPTLNHSRDWFLSFEKEELYLLLQESAKRHPLFSRYLAWIKEEVLANNADITAEKIAEELNISLGEVLIILDEILIRAQKD
ncbi:MAG: hypothetical protein ACFFBD_27080 [Candidatus Hodarchaeota archaeon]